MTDPLVYADFIDDARVHAMNLLNQAGVSVAPDDAHDAGRVLFAYFNIARKYIAPRPRGVHYSVELEARSMPTEVSVGVQLVAARAIAGDGLGEHLSERAVRTHTHDWLLNHWGIHHLHVRYGRGSELLYVWVEPDDLYLIDVLDHSDMANIYLPEIVLRNWPHLLGPSAPGVTARPLSAETIDQARRSGIYVPFALSDGKVYMPNGTGLILGSPGSRGHSLDAHRQADLVMQTAHAVETDFRQRAERAAREAGVTELHLHYNPATGVVTETITGHTWPTKQ